MAGECIFTLWKVLRAWSSSLSFSKSLTAPHFLQQPTKWSPIIHQWTHKESIVIIPPFRSWVMEMLLFYSVCLTRSIYAWWTVVYKLLISFSRSFRSKTSRRIRAFSLRINVFLDFDKLFVFIYTSHSFHLQMLQEGRQYQIIIRTDCPPKGTSFYVCCLLQINSRLNTVTRNCCCRYYYAVLCWFGGTRNSV